MGYRVLDIDRNPVSSFTADRVIETNIVAQFVVVGGVEAPDEGGYIVWGLQDYDIAEATIDPVPIAIVQAVNRLRTLTKELPKRLGELLPERCIELLPEPAVIDTATFEAGVRALHQEYEARAKTLGDQQSALSVEIQRQLDRAIEAIAQSGELSVTGQKVIEQYFGRLSEVLGEIQQQGQFTFESIAQLGKLSESDREAIVQKLGEILPVWAEYFADSSRRQSDYHLALIQQLGELPGSLEGIGEIVQSFGEAYNTNQVGIMRRVDEILISLRTIDEMQNLRLGEITQATQSELEEMRQKINEFIRQLEHIEENRIVSQVIGQQRYSKRIQSLQMIDQFVQKIGRLESTSSG